MHKLILSHSTHKRLSVTPYVNWLPRVENNNEYNFHLDKITVLLSAIG